MKKVIKEKLVIKRNWLCLKLNSNKINTKNHEKKI